jgi:anaerobic magnesium-protoporphyrin IX monomethyl ester cyclase
MDILLAKCPRTYTSHFQENSESLALGYLAASLTNARCEAVHIVDGSLTGLSLGEILRQIMEWNPNLIGFTISDSTFLESTFQCAELLRSKGIKSHIILGGYTPSFQHREILEACPAVDSVCRFEGEQTIVELAKTLGARGDWRKVPGIAYREGKSVVTSPLRPALRNLDDLPFPSRDVVPFILSNLSETGVISVSGSRGCYADCSFCSIRSFYDAQAGPPIRLRSARSVVDEIEHLVRTYGRREILLVDDVFVLPGKAGVRRLDEFRDEFNRRDLRVMLSVSERACSLTEDVCVRLKGIGVRQVLVGVEAGSDELLDYYNKKTSIDQNRRAIELLHRFEIDPTVSFISFSPATTLPQLRQNLRFLLSLRVNFLQGLLNRYQIYPGTPLGDEILQSGKFVGTFPKYEYIPDDVRTDMVYAVVRQTCGQFLTIAFELKRIERKLRRFLFNSEASAYNSAGIRKARAQFLSLQQGIMEDAAGLFEWILDRVESTTPERDSEIEDLVTVHRALVRDTFKTWLYQLVFFERCHPDLTGDACCTTFIHPSDVITNGAETTYVGRAC